MKLGEYIDFKIHLMPPHDEKIICEVVLLPTMGIGEVMEPVKVPAEKSLSLDQLPYLANKSITLRQLVKFGKGLANCLLPEGSLIRDMFFEAYRLSGKEGGGVRLRLFIADHNLKQLPWEYIFINVGPDHNDSMNGFIALDPRISIVRHEALTTKHPESVKSSGDVTDVRMLIAAASPETEKLEPLNITREIELVQNALLDFKMEGMRITVDPVLRDVTKEELFDSLLSPHYIFHFIGHGNIKRQADNFNIGNIKQEGYLSLLQDKNGKMEDPVYAHDLAKHLQHSGVRLAVLGACLSGFKDSHYPWHDVAGALVAREIPAVIAMQHMIYDDHVIAFNRSLYVGLASGLSLDEAVWYGRSAMATTNNGPNASVNVEWGVPVLYTRLLDGALFPERMERARLTADDIRNRIQNDITDVDRSHGEASSASTRRFISVSENIEKMITPRIAPARLQYEIVGRDDELERGKTKVEKGQKLYFYGPYGIGKTCLCNTLFNQKLKTNDLKRSFLWHRVSNMSVETTVEAIASYFGDASVAQAAGRVNKTNALHKLLSQYPDLLIGLDDVQDRNVAQAILNAAGDSAVILNGNRRLGLSDLVKVKRLKPLVLQEAEKLFAKFAGLDLKQINEEDKNHIRKICIKMGNLPLAVKLAALVCVDRMESLSELWERLKVAPTTIIPEYEEISTIFETIFQHVVKSPLVLRMLLRIASFPALEAPAEALSIGNIEADYFISKDKLLSLGLVNPVSLDRLALHPLLGLMSQERTKAKNAKMVKKEKTWVNEWLMNYASKNQENYNNLFQEHDNLLGLLERFRITQNKKYSIKLIDYLFDYLRVRGHWQVALDWLNEAKTAASQLGQITDQAKLLLYQGIIHILRGEYDFANQTLEEADDLYKAEMNFVGRGQVLSRQGMISALTGQLQVAQQRLETALEFMGTQAPVHDIALTHEKLASVFSLRGHSESSKKHLDKALTLGCAGNDMEVQSRVHLALGFLARKAGDYSIANSHYRSAAKFSKNLGYRLQTANLNVEEGYMLFFQGKYADAKKSFNEALEHFRELKYRIGEANALHGLGNVALTQDDLSLAQKQFNNALDINKIIDNQAGILRNRYQLAVILHRRENAFEVEKLFMDLQKMAKKGKFIELEAACWHQLGRIYLSESKWKDVEICANKSLKLAKKTEARLVELSALTLLGLVDAHNGDLINAKKKLLNSHETFLTLNAPQAEGSKSFLDQLEEHIPSEGLAITDNGFIIMEDDISQEIKSYLHFLARSKLDDSQSEKEIVNRKKRKNIKRNRKSIFEKIFKEIPPLDVNVDGGIMFDVNVEGEPKCDKIGGISDIDQKEIKTEF